MWILIKRDIPVQTEYRPQWLGIYWGVWWIDSEQISRAFWNFYHEEGEIFVKKRYQESLIPPEVFENIYNEEKYPEEYEDVLKAFMKSDCFVTILGLDPNPARAVRIIVNNEAIKIWPHEYAEISNDKLISFLADKAYISRPSNIAEEKIDDFIIEGIARTVYEEAVMDGCTDFEARLMVMGINVAERYDIPPVGWYEYVGPKVPERWKQIGMPLDKINH